MGESIVTWFVTVLEDLNGRGKLSTQGEPQEEDTERDVARATNNYQSRARDRCYDITHVTQSIQG